MSRGGKRPGQEIADTATTKTFPKNAAGVAVMGTHCPPGLN